MGDSWEDDDFDVQLTLPVAKPAVTKSRFEDEEIIREDKPKEKAATPMTEEQKRAVQEREKREAERRKREAWVQQELAMQQNETPEQRAQRERRRQEEADAELAADLFGGLAVRPKKSDAGPLGLPGLGASMSSAASTGSGQPMAMKINTQKEMLSVAKQLGPALKEQGNGKAMEYMLELMDRATKDTMELDEVVGLLNCVTKLRDEKQKAEAALKVAAALEASKKTAIKTTAATSSSSSSSSVGGAKDPKKTRAQQARDDAADFIGGQFSKTSTTKAAAPSYDLEDDFM